MHVLFIMTSEPSEVNKHEGRLKHCVASPLWGVGWGGGFRAVRACALESQTQAMEEGEGDYIYHRTYVLPSKWPAGRFPPPSNLSKLF